MAAFAARRLATLLVTLILASIAVFLVMEVVPGDPAAFMLGIGATEETVAVLRAELGLDLPPAERYFAWIGGILQGRFRDLLHL